MPEAVTREGVARLFESGAEVVEVLPREEFEELHIAGAIGIPLNELGGRARDELDPSRPVITYCHDFL